MFAKETFNQIESECFCGVNPFSTSRYFANHKATMSQRAKPEGDFAFPLILFSFVSLLLGTGAEVMGVFEGLSDQLRDLWRVGGLEIQSEMGLPGLAGILVTAATCFGVLAAVLGSPGSGRRCLIGFSSLFLSFTLIPAFAVWGIFWKPFGMMLAVLWSWFSAMVYAQTHTMPCDGAVGGLTDPATRLEKEARNEQVTQGPHD